MRTSSLRKDVNDEKMYRKIYEKYQVSNLPFFYNKFGEIIPLLGQYNGCGCFMICAGPSIKSINPITFTLPGIVSLGVNNVPRTIKTSFWVCVDKPDNFITSIWLDPKIMKFVPFAFLRSQIWDIRNGRWQPLQIGDKQILVEDCPNVVFYKRNEKFNAKRYLTEETINWGDKDRKEDGKLIESGCRSVMLSALRVLYLLGFKRIYLVGADFNMTVDYTYSFEQERSPSSIIGNNRTYVKMIERFEQLKEGFDKDGFKVMNCNKDSRLKVFDFIDLQDAIDIEKSWLGNLELENTEGLYDNSWEEKIKKVFRMRNGEEVRV